MIYSSENIKKTETWKIGWISPETRWNRTWYELKTIKCLNLFLSTTIMIQHKKAFGSARINKFDICGSSSTQIDSRYGSGFIHSPNYPNYYGNSKNCQLEIKIPDDKRIVIYVVRVSLEDTSVFHDGPNDFVQISGRDLSSKLHGLHTLPKFIYEGNDRKQFYVNFKSDWITTQSLTFPKGFYIYFECNKCLLLEKQKIIDKIFLYINLLTNWIQ
jgi:hypothetical protein